jgi:hypothetical protein
MRCPQKGVKNRGGTPTPHREAGGLQGRFGRKMKASARLIRFLREWLSRCVGGSRQSVDRRKNEAFPTVISPPGPQSTTQSWRLKKSSIRGKMDNSDVCRTAFTKKKYFSTLSSPLDLYGKSKPIRKKKYTDSIIFDPLSATGVRRNVEKKHTAKGKKPHLPHDMCHPFR